MFAHICVHGEVYYSSRMAKISIRNEYRALFNLAWPVLLGSLQWILLNLVDTAMLGAAGTLELAAINSGRAVTWVAVMVGIGLLSGVPVFVARAVGAQRLKDCGLIWRQGMVYACITGIAVAIIVTLTAKPALTLLGQPPELIAQAGGYAIVIAWVFPVAFMMKVSDGFLQGISRPKIGMIIGLLAVPLNILFNWVFIYGRFGLPAMGAAGAALGTLLADCVAFTVMLLYLRQMKDRAIYDLFGSWRGLWTSGRPLRHFGYAPGLASGLELGGTSVLMALAGALGTATGAAFAAVSALHVVAMAPSVGFAVATSVRIGEATGAGLRDEVAQRGWIACLGAILMTAICSMLFLVIPKFWLGLFHLQADALVTASAMLSLLAPFLLFDSAQSVLLFALRSCGDQIVASAIQITGFFFLMGGAGLYAVKIAGLGAQGVIIGLNIGMVFTALALAWRYQVIIRRIERGEIAIERLA
jgi:multidrug resistance protein, MATE family